MNKLIEKFKELYTKGMQVPHKEAILFILILLVSLFFHFYLLKSNLYFAQDPANQMNISRDILLKHNFPFDGPGASIEGGGNYGITHGAFYYYLLIFPGVIFQYNPLGMAFSFAIASCIAGILLYLVCKDVFGKRIAFISFFLYTISYSVIHLGREQTNPNLVGFFTILALFAFLRFLQGKRYFLLLFLFSVSAVTQIHLSAYITILILLCFLPVLVKKEKDVKLWLGGVILFLIPLIPTIIQQFHYHFSVLHFILSLFIPHGGSTLLAHIKEGYYALTGVFDIEFQIGGGLFAFLIILTGVLLLLRYYRNEKTNFKKQVYLYIMLMIIFSFLEYAVYPGPIIQTYAEHLFVLFPILISLFLSLFWEKRELILIAIIILVTISYINLKTFKHEIMQGKKYYEIENRICKILQKNHAREYDVLFTAPFDPGNPVLTVKDPAYITFTCDVLYNIPQPGTYPHLKPTVFHFTTDMRTSLTYTISS